MPHRLAALFDRRALAISGVVLLAVTMRSGVAAVSPLVELIREDFVLPNTFLAVLAAIPPACFALAGLFSTVMSNHVRPERLVVGAMVLATASLVARGFVTDSVGLLVATIGLFVAVGIGNIALPPLVKGYFPNRIAAATATYTTVMACATLAPPLVGGPLATQLGWRFSLAIWAVFAALAIVPWAVLAVQSRTRGGARSIRGVTAAALRMWRHPVAWALLTIFTVAAIFAYTAFTWLPTVLAETARVDADAAAGLLALYAAIGLPLSLLAPALARRPAAVRLMCLLAAMSGGAGLAGILLAPAFSPVLWVLLWALAGVMFPLALTLMSMKARTAAGAEGLSIFVQGCGYATAAAMTFGFGALHELSDGWVVPLLFLAVILVAVIPAGIVLGRPTTVEDRGERRPVRGD